MLQGDGLTVRSDAILSVGAPVDAATGLAHVEVASRIDEHFLAAEKAAVVLSRGLGFIVAGQHLLCSLAFSRQLSAVSSSLLSAVSRQLSAVSSSLLSAVSRQLSAVSFRCHQLFFSDC